MRIGIFGGTFDPIHKGHLAAAATLLEVAELDQILFMPAGDPPHKTDRRVTPGPLRLQMVQAALQEAGNPKFVCSAMEVERVGYTYTVDTLRALHDQHTETNEYVWIIGADVLADLKHWKEYQAVFQLCGFVAMHRPGYSRQDFQKEYEALTCMGAQIQFAQVPPVDLSSTEIRELVHKGMDFRETVAAGVADIIETAGLYREPDKPWTAAQIQQDLERRLSPKRYAHTMRVMAESERIAHMVGADPVRCSLAGLLHDAAREFTASQYLWIGIDTHNKETILLHGAASALLAQKRYGVQDEDILQAIACHTTGKPGMNQIAQIVFVADYTEPGRMGPHFDQVRKVLAEQGLLAAVAAECQMTIDHRREIGKPIDTDTIETRDWAQSQIE